MPLSAQLSLAAPTYCHTPDVHVVAGAYVYCRDAIQGLGSLFSGLAALSGFLATTLVASSSFQRAVKPWAYENARRREVERNERRHEADEQARRRKVMPSHACMGMVIITTLACTCP
jgi:hypothetical protein